MTYREYIEKTAARFLLTSDDIDLLLENQKTLIPDADADVDARTAKVAMVHEFASLIPLANISEGGYSVSWNLDAIKLWYNATCDELGLTPSAVGKPKIRNKSDVW